MKKILSKLFLKLKKKKLEKHEECCNKGVYLNPMESER